MPQKSFFQKPSFHCCLRFFHCLLAVRKIGYHLSSVPTVWKLREFPLKNYWKKNSVKLTFSLNNISTTKYHSHSLRRAGQNFLPLGWEFYYHPSDWVRTLHSVMAINCTINLTQCENFRIFLHSDFTWNQLKIPDVLKIAILTFLRLWASEPFRSEVRFWWFFCNLELKFAKSKIQRL